VLLIALQV